MEQLKSPGLPDNVGEILAPYRGQKMRVEQWNHEAYRDNIRHYAWGLSDDNPLYCDPEYAAKTKWKGIIASPTFPYACFAEGITPGLPDIQWYYNWADWEFSRPIRPGDKVFVDATYLDSEERVGRAGIRTVIQTGLVRNVDENDHEYSRYVVGVARVPRSDADGGLKYEARQPTEWTLDQVEDIKSQMVNEYVRGGDTLYWEDVSVGELLPETVRGPLNRLDMMSYYAGAVGTCGYKASKLKAKYQKWALEAPEKLPNNWDMSYFSPAISPSLGHHESAVAQQSLGMPGVYDNGAQRIGMTAMNVTNWMGDDAFMRKFYARVKLPVIFGDVTTTTSIVTGKRVENGLALIDLAISTKNQLGQEVTQGRATVEVQRRTTN